MLADVRAAALAAYRRLIVPSGTKSYFSSRVARGRQRNRARPWGHTWNVQRFLGDGWSIELSDTWTRGSAKDGVTTWRAAGRTMRVGPGGSWRCANGADIIASLDAELPPNPTGKVGEGGRDGVGHRAAWLYRQDGDVKFTLYGFNFIDGTYLETTFISADTADLTWAFDAWRSVTRSDG